MAYVSKIKSSDNTVNYIKNGVYPVKGTQTAATGAWTGELNLPALYDGLTIAYYLPYNGSGNATLNLTLSDGTTTGAVNCYVKNADRLTTHYGAGSTILLTYWSAGSIKVSGTATTDNRWTHSEYWSDTIDSRITYFYGKTGTSKGIWAGSYFMETGAGRYENICTASDGTVASNRTTATTKLRNTTGFRIGSNIYYSNTNYNANTGINGWGVVYTMYGNVLDSRYMFNTTLTAGSLTANEPVYLVGTISNGLFYLDETWWTQTATTVGKVYVLTGYCFDSTTSNCRVSLLQHNPWYIYDGSKLIPYSFGYWQYNSTNDCVELVFPN